MPETTNNAGSSPVFNQLLDSIVSDPAPAAAPADAVAAAPLPADANPSSANGSAVATGDPNAEPQIPAQYKDDPDWQRIYRRGTEAIKAAEAHSAKVAEMEAQLNGYKSWDPAIERLKANQITDGNAFLTAEQEFEKQQQQGQIIRDLDGRMKLQPNDPRFLTPLAARELFTAMTRETATKDELDMIRETRVDGQIRSYTDRGQYALADVELVKELHKATGRPIAELMQGSHAKEVARRDRLRTEFLAEQDAQRRKPPVAGGNGVGIAPGKAAITDIDALLTNIVGR